MPYVEKWHKKTLLQIAKAFFVFCLVEDVGGQFDVAVRAAVRAFFVAGRIAFAAAFRCGVRAVAVRTAFGGGAVLAAIFAAAFRCGV